MRHQRGEHPQRGGGIGVVEPVLEQEVGRRRHHPHQGDDHGGHRGDPQLHQQPVGAEDDDEAQRQRAGHLDGSLEAGRDLLEDAGVQVEQWRLAVEVPDAGNQIVLQQADVQQLPLVGEERSLEDAVVESDPGGGSSNARQGEGTDQHGHRPLRPSANEPRSQSPPGAGSHGTHCSDHTVPVNGRAREPGRWRGARHRSRTRRLHPDRSGPAPWRHSRSPPRQAVSVPRPVRAGQSRPMNRTV